MRYFLNLLLQPAYRFLVQLVTMGSSYYVVHAAAISPRFSTQQCSTTSVAEKIIRVSSHEPITCCRKPYNKFHAHPKEKLALSLSLSLIIPLLLHWKSRIRNTKKRESKVLHVGKCVGTGIVFLLQKSRRVSRVSIGLEIVY